MNYRCKFPLTEVCILYVTEPTVCTFNRSTHLNPYTDD